MESLAPLLAGIKDIAVLVPVLGCIGLGWLHVVWRREEREDRKAMLEVVNANTAALNGVRIALAAQTGKTV
jgi:hypothetical protein